MKRVLQTLVCLLAVAGHGLSGMRGHQEVTIRGFSPEAAARQTQTEATFRAVPTPDRAREDLRALTREPHVAGTPEDYRTAQYVLDQFREAGLDADIAEYRVLLPMPKEVKVDLVEPFKRQGPTPEQNWDGEKESQDSAVVPAFNAYSPSGDVTAQVVYANFGLPRDYDRLKDLGIDVTGKIVMVRYGKCFRGVKAYVAEQHHAAGLLIYSDPADDGYRRGDVYPRGPWRPDSGVQRGSILYLTSYAGDPLTPGIAASQTAERLKPEDAETLPKIPTTPISYRDASPILENLGGAVAPAEWQGALPFTYHVGPGASKVHLKLEMDFEIRPIWNVVARIPGTVQPDRWVVVGNHRDAWTYGAVDPNSGTAPLLAVARGLGQLLKQGWTPKRTIILASWDGEEFGLLGSTEWAEDHAEVLGRNAVAYLNMDVGVSGTRFSASAIPSLRRLIIEVTREFKDPATGRDLVSLWSEESRHVKNEGGIPITVPDEKAAPVSAGPRVGDLGSGSDYTPFLQHLGVPSLDIGFGGPYGVYHASSDNFFWMESFGDPTFRYSVLAAQIYGTLALRLADADVLPFDYEDYGKAMEKYLDDLDGELKKNGDYGRLHLKSTRASAARFAEAARSLGKKLGEVKFVPGLDPEGLSAVNGELLEVERNFLLDKGLPGRAWFRHAFYAPGVYTGYAAVVFPGIREAAGKKDWTTASEQLNLVQAAIDRGTATLGRALRKLDDSLEAASKRRRPQDADAVGRGH
ncbi:MAG TPA: M28 family metallopeptidase [Terriglobia bacterium]|nr:M28 family metallopeptidase [Terriglobia bacterium]